MGFPQLSLKRVIPTIAAPKVPIILLGAATVEDSGSKVPHEPSLTVCIQNMWCHSPFSRFVKFSIGKPKLCNATEG
jgi:hypothetical protein